MKKLIVDQNTKIYKRIEENEKNIEFLLNAMEEAQSALVLAKVHDYEKAN
jgi:hypothetical protein